MTPPHHGPHRVLTTNGFKNNYMMIALTLSLLLKTTFTGRTRSSLLLPILSTFDRTGASTRCSNSFFTLSLSLLLSSSHKSYTIKLLLRSVDALAIAERENDPRSRLHVRTKCRHRGVSSTVEKLWISFLTTAWPALTLLTLQHGMEW
eukprot:sb/3473680/